MLITIFLKNFYHCNDKNSLKKITIFALIVTILQDQLLFGSVSVSNE